MKEVYINCDQCRKVVKSLNDYFKLETEVAHIDYPPSIAYKSNQYILFMFYSCLLDYGMRSRIYHNHLVETYQKYPNIFDPSFVINMEEDELKSIIINNIHPRYPNVAVKKWLELSRKLIDYHDILCYLKSINRFEDLHNFIRQIKGYGQKTGGLLIRIICDAGVCNFKDDVQSIPIDRHDMEISYLTGVIHDKKLGSKDIERLSQIYVKIAKEQGINPSNIDKYLWEVGSSFCNKKECIKCPLNKYCKESKKIV